MGSASFKNYLKDIRDGGMVPMPSMIGHEMKSYNSKLIEADASSGPAYGPKTLLQMQQAQAGPDCSEKTFEDPATESSCLDADGDTIMGDSPSPSDRLLIRRQGHGQFSFRPKLEATGTDEDQVMEDSPSPERAQAVKTLMHMHRNDQALRTLGENEMEAEGGQYDGAGFFNCK